MIKNVLKVLYVAFGLILAFLVYLMGYNTNGYNHIKNMTAKAIENKDYVEVAMIHGGCFAKTNLVSEDSDVLDLAIFPSTTLVSTGFYTEGDKTTTVNSYDNSYYIYIFNPTYDMRDVNSGKLVNSTGVRFISDHGSYDYFFKITDSVNSDYYVSKPSSVSEVLLNGSRDLTAGYNNWGFFNVTLTHSMISAMSSKLNGSINRLAVLNSSGEAVYTIDIDLDFSQQFFTDVAPLIENYNIYIDEANSEDKNIKNAAEDKFNKFYLGEGDNKGFEETFRANENYTFRHPDKYLQPSKLIWQTIGILVIYLVCFALLYMLFFHFNFLKRLITREGHNDYKKNPGAERKNVINAKVNEKKSKQKELNSPEKETIEKTEEAKEETLKDESVEEVQPSATEEGSDSETGTEPKEENPVE